MAKNKNGASHTSRTINNIASPASVTALSISVTLKAHFQCMKAHFHTYEGPFPMRFIRRSMQRCTTISAQNGHPHAAFAASVVHQNKMSSFLEGVPRQSQWRAQRHNRNFGVRVTSEDDSGSKPIQPLLASSQVATSKWGCVTPHNCQRIYVICYNTLEIIQLKIYKLYS